MTRTRLGPLFCLLSLLAALLAGCDAEPPASAPPPPSTDSLSGTVVPALPVPSGEDFATADYAFRIKHLDALLARLNFREDPRGRRLRDEPGDRAKEALLRSLLARECLDTLSPGQWAAFVGDRRERFTEFSLQDSNWYARVAYQATLRGEPVSLGLTLRLEYGPTGGSRWVLVGAQADFLRQLSPFGASGGRPLSPEAHELDFLRLAVSLEDPDRLPGLARPDYAVDYLSIVYYLLRTGELRLGAREHIELYFLQYSGWLLRVRNLARQSRNSGWLITGLTPLTESQKNSLIIEELGVTDPRLVRAGRPGRMAPGEGTAPLELADAYALAEDFARQGTRLFTATEADAQRFEAFFDLFTSSEAWLPNDLKARTDRVPLWKYLELLTDEYARTGELTLHYDLDAPEKMQRDERYGTPYALVPVRKTLISDRVRITDKPELIVIDLVAGRIDQVIESTELN